MDNTWSSKSNFTLFIAGFEGGCLVFSALFISVDASLIWLLLLLLCSGVPRLENSYESKMVVTVSNFTCTVIVVVVLVVFGRVLCRFSLGELLKLLPLKSLVIKLY